MRRSEDKIVNCQFSSSSSSHQYSSDVTSRYPSDVTRRKKGDWPSKLNFANYHRQQRKDDFLDVFSVVNSDEEISPEVVGSIPASVFANAKPILDERKAKMEQV